jgi:GT2 family glycosyltransferase
VEPEEQPRAPLPVVAVVVTHDAPGERLDPLLAALAGQDHPNLDVLVVDTGTTDVTDRVAAVLPAALVHRVDPSTGFGAAANTVLDLVSGAAYYLFCHDDVVPAPRAVSALVEAAEAWEADVVGPKLVTWDDPGRLAQFGAAVDRLGVALPLVERRELDQGQHDGLRDVFSVPGAFTLVRAERFAEVGGFDEAITFLGDDLSLAWRVRIAGGRVLVTSAARVRHAEAFADRPEGRHAARLAARHRVRVVLTSYSPLNLLAIVPQAVAYSAAEVVGAVVTGSPGRARAAVGAWGWNLGHLRSLVTARREVAGFRKVPDREVRRHQVRGLVGPRLRLLRLEGDGGADAGRHASAGGRAAAVPVRGQMVVDPAAWSPATAVVAVVTAAVVLFGCRHLLTRFVPAAGELLPFGSGSGALVGEWAGWWRPAGLGTDAAVPPLVGAAGVVGGLVGGAGLARTLLAVGLLPLGVIGAHRMAAPFGAKRAQVAAAVAYAAVPLPYDALAAGRWSAAGAYAAAPWMLGRLARASGADPFRSGRDRLWRHVVATGAVTGLATVLVPQAPVLLVLMGAALVAGTLLALEGAGLARLAVAAAGGAAVAAVLQAPTTLAVLTTPGGVEAWAGAPSRADDLSLLDAVGLRTGPTALGPASFALLVAAAVPLLVGRRWRLAWAVRAWALAVACWGIVWAAGEGWIDARLPDAGVLLAPAAAGLALAAGLGLAAVELDVKGRSWRFGARRLAAVAGVLALAGSTASVAAASLDGWWGMPRDDYAGLLGFVDDDLAAAPSRVMWVAATDLLPGRDGWPLTGDLAYIVSTSALPRVGDRWPAPAGAGDGELAAALDAALDHGTTRLGHTLAPLGVQYVAVPRRLAPSDPRPPADVAAALRDALSEQLDLEQVPVDPGLALYRNTAFTPTDAVSAPGSDPRAAPPGRGPTGGDRLLLAATAALWLVALAVVLRMRFAPAPPPARAVPSSRRRGGRRLSRPAEPATAPAGPAAPTREPVGAGTGPGAGRRPEGGE